MPTFSDLWLLTPLEVRTPSSLGRKREQPRAFFVLVALYDMRLVKDKSEQEDAVCELASKLNFIMLLPSEEVLVLEQ